MNVCFKVLVFLYFVFNLGSCYRNGGYYDTVFDPIPFPPCYAIDVDCLRRGLRTFFFLMNAGHYGMKTIDPIILTSVTVSYPEKQLDFRLRGINVTGGSWSKLIDRTFNLSGGKSSVLFSSDLHVTAVVLMSFADNFDPFWAHITMDIHGIESNITYAWTGKAIDTEDYIFIGQERITARNTRTPTYFLQPSTQDSYMIDQVLQSQPVILDHISNEIAISIMHTIVENFRLFASKIPVKYYYKYNIQH